MIHLRTAELFELPLRLRMPFRYGIATLTELPHAVMRATWDIDGERAIGFAADNLPPKWFTKNAARAPADEITELWQVIRTAIRHADSIEAETPFAYWRKLDTAQADWSERNHVPALLSNFGTSVIERSLLDAFCRRHAIRFSDGLRANAFGIDLGAVCPTLRDSTPGSWIREKPAAAIFARHTIGLSDPLDASDVSDSERINDGLPQTLAENIRAYGLRHFKIKINGQWEQDRPRLERIARIVPAERGPDYQFSLDGNESFHSAEAFAEYARRLLALPGLGEFWTKLLFIEQPWHRDVALSRPIGAMSAAWPDRPPIIIDESDATLASVPTALALGYAGTSHKNCKGVFKSIVNACEIARRRSLGETLVLSGEDLTNVGPIALTQDLAVAAALGITSVERNGHHYFAGLAQFPPALQQYALEQHRDVFARSPAGWPRVQITDGKIAIGTINAAPFGVAGVPDCSGLRPVPLE